MGEGGPAGPRVAQVLALVGPPELHGCAPAGRDHPELGPVIAVAARVGAVEDDPLPIRRDGRIVVVLGVAPLDDHRGPARRGPDEPGGGDAALPVVQARVGVLELREDQQVTRRGQLGVSGLLAAEEQGGGLIPRPPVPDGDVRLVAADQILVVGGGAGPVHAVAVASKLGIKEVYIPKQAAVFCAFGAALADYKYVLTRFLYRRDDEVNIEEVKGFYDSLEEEGIAILKRQGVAEKDMKLVRGAEMRYFGQLHDVDVAIPETKEGEPFTEATLKELIGKFHEQHRALFGWSDPALPSVLAILKLQAIGMRAPLKLEKQPASAKDASSALKRSRSVYFKELGKFEETPCYDADRLRHGNVITGPAIVEETKTTVVVPQGAELTVDAYENYIIRR